MSLVSGASREVELWPRLDWAEWALTADTLHMWTQIVGKTRLALTPLQNHWWNVPLYVTAHGLGTSAMHYGEDVLDIEFDFVSQELHFRLGSGRSIAVALQAQTVADFYKEYLGCLEALGVSAKIHPMPVEVLNPIRFDLDTVHKTYEAEQARRFWQVLSRVEKVFKQFSSGFVGKVSPVHFFWGSCDLAVSRFSGRPAPVREGVDAVQREAYSHEVSSLGFWPGNGGYGAAAFYSYAVPAPVGFAEAAIRPAAAGWDRNLGEFVLKYEDAIAEGSPEKAIMAFAESTYEAAANLGRWDRKALERGSA